MSTKRTAKNGARLRVSARILVKASRTSISFFNFLFWLADAE